MSKQAFDQIAEGLREAIDHVSPTQIYTDHADVLDAIGRVRRFLAEAYLADDESCPPGDWTMGCAGCQARMIDLQLDMLRRDIEDASVRAPAA